MNQSDPEQVVEFDVATSKKLPPLSVAILIAGSYDFSQNCATVGPHAAIKNHANKEV